MHFVFLEEIVVLFMLSTFVVLICSKFKIPTIVGLLISGLICGPSALGLITDHNAVDLMAEIGVALLLFTIGMELSTKELLRIRRPLLIGGTGQVAITIGVSVLIFFSFVGFSQAIVFGCLITLSSTAIVLSIFQQKAQSESPQGRICLAILIFQDLIIVPMMLLFPLLAGGIHLNITTGLLALGKSVLVLLGIFLFGRYILPRLMLSVVRTRSRELMIMTTLGLCLAVALLTASIGLSLSLGAFLAGLLLAESEYSLSVMENVLPFKEVFTSIFFVSVGMLLDLQFFFNHISIIISIAIAIIVVKILVMLPVVRMVGYSPRTAIIAALSMAQIGEFSFVLARAAMDVNLMDTAGYQTFLAASIMTMAMTPVFMSLAPSIASKILQRKNLLPEIQDSTDNHEILKDHIIIIGFGVGGKSLAEVAKDAGIPYIISEMNPDTVKRYREIEPIIHGDASFPMVLEHLKVKTARVLAIMIPDPVGTRAIISHARKFNPSLHIVVRTRFLGEVQSLRQLGANDVIPEEFETAIEVFARVLNHYLIPRQEIERQVNRIREEHYDFSQHPRTSSMSNLHDILPNLEFASYEVEKNSIMDGHTLSEGTLRHIYHITVAGIQRQGKNLEDIDAETKLQPGDLVYLFGSQDAISKVQNVFVQDSQQI